MKDFPLEILSISMKYSTEALMGGIKAVITEKYDFEHRDKTIRRAPSSFWDYRGFDTEKLNELSIESFSKFKNFWDLE